MRKGGAEAIQALQDLGVKPGDDDLPPPLKWETPVWKLFQTLQRQWRVGFNGAVGLDLNVFIPAIQAKRWKLDLALDLVHVIENGMLTDLAAS